MPRTRSFGGVFFWTKKATLADRLCCRNVLLGDLRINADALARFANPFELHNASDGREDGIISTLLCIDPRHDFGATLAVENRTGRNKFAIPGFAAESPTSRITAVLGARNALFGSEELEIDIELHELYFLSSFTASGWEVAMLVN